MRLVLMADGSVREALDFCSDRAFITKTSGNLHANYWELNSLIGILQSYIIRDTIHFNKVI